MELEWKQEIDEVFLDACLAQGAVATKFSCILEALSRGWRFETAAVVDMQNECLRSVVQQYAALGGHTIGEADAGPQSIVWSVLKEVFQNFAYLHPEVGYLTAQCVVGMLCCRGGVLHGCTANLA